MLDAVEIASHRAAVNGVELHYMEAGSGPLIVLLHGFPESWYSWRHQIPTLARAGFRVVAPDLRGYNLSSKPDGVDAYRITTVAADITALIEHLGAPAVLVGHDWGGLTSWVIAMTRPELLRKLIVVNMPHPVPLSRELRRTFKQKLRLSYQLFMQPPIFPELLMRVVLPILMRVAGKFTAEERAEYRRAWAQPGARRAMVNYYRALRRHAGDIRKLIRPITIPVLLIWGENDPVFGHATTENFDDQVPNLRVVYIADAGHFVQTDEPELVGELMAGFARADG